MTAREYLSQAYHIDQRINSKIEQVASLRDLSFKATATLTDMPGGSRNVHSKENIVAKMMDLENEINADIDNLVDIKRDVVSMINSVDNKDCQLLLEMRYLCFMPWERIAIEMQRSLRSIYRLHDKALEKISQKIKVGS